jgi:hypothetical protein
MRNVPEVLIPRIEFGLVDALEGDVACVRVGERIHTGVEVPFPPGCDNPEVRSECGIAEFEADLIVSLSRAPMRDRIRTDQSGDLDLTLSKKWTCHSVAQQVLTTAHSPHLQSGPDEVLYERLAEILPLESTRARSECFGLQPLQPAVLAHITRHADDVGSIVLR